MKDEGFRLHHCCDSASIKLLSLLVLLLQLPTSGLSQRCVVTSRPAVLPMALSVMGHGSWSLEGWWNMANIATTCMSYRSVTPQLTGTR